MVVLNERRELARIAERIDRFGDECGLAHDDTAQINLILDELVSNVIKYGYDDRLEHQLHVSVEVADNLLTISIEDDGRPFNPLEAPAPDFDLPIDARPIGKLGLFLVRSITDTLDYRRERGRNILKLMKRLQPQSRERDADAKEPDS